MHAILRLPDVKQRTELSRSTIYLRIAQGPSQCAWASRAVGWLEAEVEQWLQRRIEASRSESRGVGATLGAAAIFELKNVTTYPSLSQRYDFHAPIA
jgi:prophage regulatory protein